MRTPYLWLWNQRLANDLGKSPRSRYKARG
jgi:hypothetical protein